jgi:hypothetical protein
MAVTTLVHWCRRSKCTARAPVVSPAYATSLHLHPPTVVRDPGMPTYFKTCPLLGIYVSEVDEEAGFEVSRKWYDLHDRLIFNGFFGIR